MAASRPSRRVSRRSVVKGLAAGPLVGVFSGIGPRVSLAANDKLQIASMGVANQAAANLSGVAGQAIVALCDIDDTHLARLTAPQPQFPGARIYNDYRELIEKETGKVDAVVVSTADHHHVPASIGHHAEEIRACREGTPTTCNFGYSGPLSEAVLLGNVAYRAGKRFEWDAAATRVTNSPEADALVRKAYRQGWEVA